MMITYLDKKKGGKVLKLSERSWAIIILFIVLLSIVLPYTLLSNVPRWYGSFFLWIFLTVIVIIINHFITKDWGKEE